MIVEHNLLNPIEREMEDRKSDEMEKERERGRKREEKTSTSCLNTSLLQVSLLGFATIALF